MLGKQFISVQKPGRFGKFFALVDSNVESLSKRFSLPERPVKRPGEIDRPFVRVCGFSLQRHHVGYACVQKDFAKMTRIAGRNHHQLYLAGGDHFLQRVQRQGLHISESVFEYETIGIISMAREMHHRTQGLGEIQLEIVLGGILEHDIDVLVLGQNVPEASCFEIKVQERNSNVLHFFPVKVC
ncbi:unnamed protein product [Pseudo-nitzschia multistriata]|uniref:Uncharacterized protein n=1 Tax=Pseudo-nitzschia multistriata TaxID=183589 RepID=A0A448ZPA9_9STRA|nr:unnamed protein product [Pseudo-nitzschia multistriata]